MSDGSDPEEYRDADDDKVSSQQDVSSFSVSEEDDYDVQPSGKRKGKLNKLPVVKPKKKIKKNRFIEQEAEEASEEEEDIDEDFKKNTEMKDKEYQKQFQDMLGKSNKRDIIKNLEEKYRDQPDVEQPDQYDVDGLDSMDDEVEAPAILDAKIWRVGCKRGKENDSAMSIMFKFANYKLCDQPLEIVSAFALKKFPGAFFVEAPFDWQVVRAIEGLYNVRQGPVEMVEQEQCRALFSPIEHEEITIKPGDWVRVKSHQMFEGDLGRALTVDPLRRTVFVKLIPREKREIASFTHNEQPASKEKAAQPTAQFSLKGEIEEENNEPKPSKWYYRTKYLIDQKRFVRGPKIHIKYDKRVSSYHNDDEEEETNERSIFLYGGNISTEREQCKKDGFVGITTSITNVVSRNVKPTLDELAFFYPDIKDIRNILPRLMKSLRPAVETQHHFHVGDTVYVEDEKRKLQGIVFKIIEAQVDGKFKIRHTKRDPETNNLKEYIHEVEPAQLRIALRKYQQVTVISGPHRGVQGVIIDINKKTAIITSDQGRAVECFLGDLQHQNQLIGYDQTINADPYKAQLLGSHDMQQVNPTLNVGGVTRNDLIKFGTVDTAIGCVLSLTKDDITILDLTNKVQTINLMTVTAKLNTRNNVAKNSHRHEIRKGDLIVILDGFYKGCKSTVIHVYRDYLFLHSGRFDNTQGIIVEKVNNCALISSVSSGTNDRTKQRPVDTVTTGPTQDLVGQNLTIARGKWSGYRGLVISVQARTVSVQLTAKNLTVNVLKEEIAPSSGTTTQHHLAPGQTPHYAPHQSVRIWDDNDNQKVMQGYQSPYVYGQHTPINDYQ